MHDGFPTHKSTIMTKFFSQLIQLKMTKIAQLFNGTQYLYSFFFPFISMLRYALSWCFINFSDNDEEFFIILIIFKTYTSIVIPCPFLSVFCLLACARKKMDY